MTPRALVITTAGINCDLELAEAFALAGADVESIHLNDLIRDPARIEAFQLIGIPGGFSYGDAIAAGRIAARLMQDHLGGQLRAAVERGVPIIAPCNGFQIAVQMGLLPGDDEGGVALIDNASARFTDCWSRIDVPANSRCIWTQGLTEDPDLALLPSAHGEGRFMVRDDDVLDRLAANGQIAVRYAADANPNGSVGHVAGICDPTGLVLGLMPHPERYLHWTAHPYWTRLDRLNGDPPGLAMFRNAVRHAMSLDVAPCS